MSKQFISAVAGAAMMVLAGAAQATPTFNAGDSSVFFNNFENLYRPTATCSAQYTCLDAVTGDPAGFRRINPAQAGNLLPNDVFIGILSVQNVHSTLIGDDTYNSVPGDRYTGYFVQKIDSIGFAAGGNVQLNLVDTVDPFGILAAGEMFRFYSGVPSYFTNGGSNVTAGIAAATAGTFWGAFGIGTEGFAYTLTNPNVSVATSNTEAYFALDIVTYGPSYSAGALNKLNDFNEDLVGGTIANPGAQLCTAAEIANPLISCTDVVGTSEIEANSAFSGNGGGGSSPWMFASNDPYDLNAVPEPGSVALVGLALAGLGMVGRKKRVAK